MLAVLWSMVVAMVTISAPDTWNFSAFFHLPARPCTVPTSPSGVGLLSHLTCPQLLGFCCTLGLQIWCVSLANSSFLRGLPIPLIVPVRTCWSSWKKKSLEDVNIPIQWLTRPRSSPSREEGSEDPDSSSVKEEVLASASEPNIR